MLKNVNLKNIRIFGRKRYGYRMKFFFFIPLSFAATKERGKEKWLFADMNAARSVHPLTAAAKVNWTLTCFRTPLYEAGHSHRIRTACRQGQRTEETSPLVLEVPLRSMHPHGCRTMHQLCILFKHFKISFFEYVVCMYFFTIFAISP